MNFALFGIAAACLVLSASAVEFEKKDGVYIITDENYHEALKTFPPTLYVFSASWCPPCQQLAPQLVLAAKTLLEMGDVARIGKIDTDTEDELVNEHGITLIPTMLFYDDKGNFVEYDGDRLADSLVEYILSQIGQRRNVPKFMKRTLPAKGFRLPNIHHGVCPLKIH